MPKGGGDYRFSTRKVKYTLRAHAERAVWKILAAECAMAADRVRTVMADHFPGEEPPEELYEELKEVFLDVADHFKRGKGLK